MHASVGVNALWSGRGTTVGYHPGFQKSFHDNHLLSTFYFNHWLMGATVAESFYHTSDGISI
nr:MAG TPA: hypothetical protein [Caudoviricetes sp.]